MKNKKKINVHKKKINVQQTHSFVFFKTAISLAFSMLCIQYNLNLGLKLLQKLYITKNINKSKVNQQELSLKYQVMSRTFITVVSSIIFYYPWHLDFKRQHFGNLTFCVSITFTVLTVDLSSKLCVVVQLCPYYLQSP